MMSVQQLKNLPTVLTCFALRDEYFPELDGMLATVERHHPDWHLVIGRGALTDDDVVLFEVRASSEQCHWTLPVPLRCGGGEDDWRKITLIKGWWLCEVWNQFGGRADPLSHRILWLDADARLNGPLDIEVDPASETIAGPWWSDPNNSAHDTITSGLLLLQGARQGPIAQILNLWSRECLRQIEYLSSPTVPWAEGDQEVLTKVLARFSEADSNFRLLKLDHEKYCGIPAPDGEPQPDALVDHWMMSAKMGRKGKRGQDWPPPEHRRRASRE